MKEAFFQTMSLMTLLKGTLFLFMVTLPITIFLIGFIGIMARGSPPAKNYSMNPFVMTALMIFSGPLLVLIITLFSGKVLDALIKTTEFRQADVSVLGLGFGALVVVILGNIFIDHGFQAKRGSFGISFFAFIVIGLFFALINFLGKINLSFMNN